MDADKYIVEKYKNTFSFQDRVSRLLWMIVYILFFRFWGGTLFNGWRVFLLRLFGAKIKKGSVVYSSVKILKPKNLEMGEYSCLGPGVKLHLDKTIIGSKVTISQGSYLCSASHDITHINKPFISMPIVIKDFVWIGAEAFVGMGVTVGQGAVVGARACVFKDVEPWTVVGGNPAKHIKKREIKD